MKRNGLVFSMLIPVAILAGCGKSNTITMQYVPRLNTVVVRVQENEVIHFKDATNQFFEPTFKLGSPCTDDNDLKKGMCTISKAAPHNRYPFTCPGCEDPEIVVGSDAGIETRSLPAAKGTVKPVDLGCTVDKMIAIIPLELRLPNLTRSQSTGKAPVTTRCRGGL